MISDFFNASEILCNNFILHPFLKCEIHVVYQSVCKLYRLSDAYYVVTLNERERESYKLFYLSKNAKTYMISRLQN